MRLIGATEGDDLAATHSLAQVSGERRDTASARRIRGDEGDRCHGVPASVPRSGAGLAADNGSMLRVSDQSQDH
jgi:hypothetical protein